MFHQFLNSCRSVLEEEAASFDAVRSKFRTADDLFIGYMPMVVDDLWPIHALECLVPRSLRTHRGRSVYIATLGAKNFWAIPHFVELVRNLYEKEELPDSPNYYNMELDEILLLYSPDFDYSVALSGIGEVNVIYLHLYTETGVPVDLFCIVETAERCWINTIWKYDLSVDYIIDSHKGMGDLFQYTEFYQTLISSTDKTILPPYYFKGKFITFAPEAFECVFTLPEIKRHDASSKVYCCHWTSCI